MEIECVLVAQLALTLIEYQMVKALTLLPYSTFQNKVIRFLKK